MSGDGRRPENYEGRLGSTDEQRAAQRTDAAIRRTNREDIATLERSEAFRRWFARYAVTTLFLDFRTGNGGELQAFHGRRSLVLEMGEEFNRQAPGFYERVLCARRALENELKQEPTPEEEP